MKTQLTAELVIGVRYDAFRRHPNEGVWAIAFYRRVAAVIEMLAEAGVGIEHKLYSLCHVLADTNSWGAKDILHAWRLAKGDEKEMLTYLEAWQED